jgi:hypothetical protein
MTSALNDQEFHEQAIRTGASRHYESGNVPDRGFMVGGATNAEGIPYPEFKHPVDGFTVDHVRQHARALRDHFGASQDVHQGAWVEDGNVVLDASERVHDYSGAMTEAKKRGERAVYDIGRGREHWVKDVDGKVKN